MAEYRLSCEVLGHSADVRAVQAFAVPGELRDRLVTASRDGTACVWAEETSSTNYILKNIIQKHTGYVASLCVIPRDPSCGREKILIATGGQDKTILVHSLDEDVKEPLERYTGHGDLVTCIVFQHNQLISSSWDGTIRVWTSCTSSETIPAHKPAVWALDGLFIHDGSRRVLSCGADRSVKLWELDTKLCLHEYRGHSDVVRDVKVASGDIFLSAANDCTIRRWNIHTGLCLNEMYGHNAFVYSIALLPGLQGAGFVSGGEDGTLRVWKGDTCEQVLQLPANSVWSVCCMSNGDIACGSSDSVARVFTTVDERIASAEVLANFLTAMENHKAASSKSDIDVNTLPGIEALSRPGTKHGDTQMVNNEGIPEVYQWNEITLQWDKIGNAVARAPEKSAVYEGKEYDYVFDIELDEGSPVMRKLKLPYNKNTDPYLAADDFLNANELPSYYLDQVAEFIVKNAGEYQNTMAIMDPFTGGSRYVPGSGTQRTTSGPGYDPFTGGSRYVPGSQAAANLPPVNVTFQSGQGADPFTGRSSYHSESIQSGGASKTEHNLFFPTVDYQTFNSPKDYWDKVIGKIKEFNAALAEEKKLQEWQIIRLQDLCIKLSSDPAVIFSEDDLQLLQLLLGWPSENVLPGLDILRVALLNKSASIYFFSSADNGEAFLKYILDYAIGANADSKNQLLVLRCIANMFVQPHTLSIVDLKRPMVLSQIVQLLPASSKQSQIAVATIVQNYCHYCYCKHYVDGISDCVQACIKIIETSIETEAKFRAAVGIGTLISIDRALVKRSARPIDMLSLFEPLCKIVDPLKLSQCAGQIIQSLK